MWLLWAVAVGCGMWHVRHWRCSTSACACAGVRVRSFSRSHWCGLWLVAVWLWRLAVGSGCCCCQFRLSFIFIVFLEFLCLCLCVLVFVRAFAFTMPMSDTVLDGPCRYSVTPSLAPTALRLVKRLAAGVVCGRLDFVSAWSWSRVTVTGGAPVLDLAPAATLTRGAES